MGFLYWNDGKIRPPACSYCGSTKTSEEQDTIDKDERIRDIYIRCLNCGEIEFVGVFKYIGGHSFQNINDT